MDVRGGTAFYDAGSIKNVHISNQLVDNITADKLQPYVSPWTNFNTAIGGTPATREEFVYTAEGNETIRGFHVQLTSGASTNIAFDLKKNGSSILTGTIVFNSSGTRVRQDGTLSSNTLALDDELSMLMTVTSSTGASGVRAWANITKASLPS